MNSWRISFIDIDTSFNNPVPDSSVKGYMTIKAPKGNAEAVYFPKGSLSKIHSMVGLPSVDYPNVQDALDFNAQFGLWISSPPGSDVDYPSYFGGSYLTKYGFLPFHKETDKQNPSYIAKVDVGFEQRQFLDKTALVGEETVTVAWDSGATKKILITGVPYDFFQKVNTLTLLGPAGLITFTFTAGSVKVGSVTVGTFALDTSHYDITITGSASVDGLDIGDTDSVWWGGDLNNTQHLSTTDKYWGVDIQTDTYMYFVQKSPTEKTTTIRVTDIGYNDDAVSSDRNTISFNVSEIVYPGTSQSGGTFKGSLLTGAKDGFGASMYLKDILPDEAYSFIEVYVVKALDSGVLYKEAQSGTVTLSLLGQRYTDYADVDVDVVLGLGWDEAEKNAYSEVKLFMDPEGSAAIKTVLASLRGNTHKTATFISAIRAATKELLLTARTAAGNSDGLAYYCNEFLRKETYTGTKYWSNLIGAIGVKLARIMQDKNGGWAPMYTDVSGLGGALAVSVEKAKFEFDNDEQQSFDSAGLNPVILDSYYGLMIISQKTAHDPISLSDWSYLGHSMSFDLFKRDMYQFVMTPQLGKPNDDVFQEIRFNQTNDLLRKRLEGPNKIWSAGVCEIYNINTPEVKAARKFKIRVKVKVTVFSEFVELEFMNVDQLTTI
jgi:hypothetical protein